MTFNPRVRLLATSKLGAVCLVCNAIVERRLAPRLGETTHDLSDALRARHSVTSTTHRLRHSYQAIFTFVFYRATGCKS